MLAPLRKPNILKEHRVSTLGDAILRLIHTPPVVEDPFPQLGTTRPDGVIIQYATVFSLARNHKRRRVKNSAIFGRHMYVDYLCI